MFRTEYIEFLIHIILSFLLFLVVVFYLLFLIHVSFSIKLNDFYFIIKTSICKQFKIIKKKIREMFRKNFLGKEVKGVSK